LTRDSTEAIYTKFIKLWGYKQLMWTKSKGNNETFVYISDREAFVMINQITLSVVYKGPCLFLKAQFQTCPVFTYQLHNNALQICPGCCQTRLWFKLSSIVAGLVCIAWVFEKSVAFGLNE